MRVRVRVCVCACESARERGKLESNFDAAAAAALDTILRHKIAFFSQPRIALPRSAQKPDYASRDSNLLPSNEDLANKNLGGSFFSFRFQSQFAKLFFLFILFKSGGPNKNSPCRVKPTTLTTKH